MLFSIAFFSEKALEQFWTLSTKSEQHSFTNTRSKGAVILGTAKITKSIYQTMA
jgi:hypothetical protein